MSINRLQEYQGESNSKYYTKCSICKRKRIYYFDDMCNECSGKFLLDRIVEEIKANPDVYSNLPETDCKDHKCFSNLYTPEASYFSGLIASDGTLRHDFPVVKLKLIDREVILNFAKFIGKDGKINLSKYQNRHGTQEIYSSSVYSREIFDSLCKVGFVPNKSHIGFGYPHNKVLDRHFLRGYLEGDGSLSDGRIVIDGCLQFIQETKELLQSKYGFPTSFRKSGDSLYRLEIGGGIYFKKAFINWIYLDVPEYMIMPRKYNLVKNQLLL